MNGMTVARCGYCRSLAPQFLPAIFTISAEMA